MAEISFEIYNEEAVRILKEEDPDLLPDYSVNSGKDVAYNKKQVTNAITSGIIKGESIPKIAANLQSTIENLNESSAVSAARTAAIAAQNTGSLSAMKRLAEMGVEVQKEWVATLDSRTRASHRALDGQRRDLDEAFSNGLQYPGASGDPAERWNCRCKIKAYMPKYDSEDEPRLTYSEWTAYKKATGSTAKKITSAQYSAAKKWYTSKSISGSTKNLDIDDMFVFSRGTDISDEVIETTYKTLSPMERKGLFYISDVSIKSIPKSKKSGTTVFQIEAYSSGRYAKLQLNINKDFFAGKTVEEINKELAASSKSVANNLEEALIHESNHARLANGKSMAQLELIYEELSNIHIEGISNTAYTDGAEALAEIEVLLYRGEKVSAEAMAFYNKYMN